MNQFHTPSFGDEVFEMNTETTAVSAEPLHQSASRRMLSLDHSTLNGDVEHDRDHIVYESSTNHLDTYGTASNVITQPQHTLGQASTLLATQQQPQQTISAGAPVKPLAPYALFFRDTVKAIKQSNPACSLEEISAIVNTMWDALDDTQKNRYSQMYEEEKREYSRQLRDYRQQISEADLQTNPIGHIPKSTTESQAIVTTPTQTIVVTNPAEAPKVAEPTAPPEQIQLLTEAAAVQKCTREQCNKPAIINPDWEDEYCSNECVVIHCRNVFSEWARSLKSSPS